LKPSPIRESKLDVPDDDDEDDKMEDENPDGEGGYLDDIELEQPDEYYEQEAFL